MVGGFVHVRTVDCIIRGSPAWKPGYVLVLMRESFVCVQSFGSGFGVLRWILDSSLSEWVILTVTRSKAARGSSGLITYHAGILDLVRLWPIFLAQTPLIVPRPLSRVSCSRSILILLTTRNLHANQQHHTNLSYWLDAYIRMIYQGDEFIIRSTLEVSISLSEIDVDVYLALDWRHCR